MKKIIAILLIFALLIANWMIGYSTYSKVWFGFVWILAAAFFGGLGGLVGIFIMNAFKTKN